MADKTCLFNKCNVPPKWKLFGIAVDEAVTYSKLLGQKRGFQQVIEFNNQIPQSGRVDCYSIVDKRYSPLKGSNVDICFFEDAGNHNALYLNYSVHKQYTNESCNDLIAFLNFNANSTFHLHDSFVYIKSADKLKWVLFYGVLEFFIKNLNTSVIGSQFYFPMFSKYLIMNELRLLFVLQNWWKSLSKTPTTAHATDIAASRSKKILSGDSCSASTLQIVENKACIPSEKAVGKIGTSHTSSQKYQLKRKSVDSYTGDECLSNSKRFKSENNACNCKKYGWTIFTSFQRTFILNYTSILEAKNSIDASEVSSNCSSQASFKQNLNSSAIHHSHCKSDERVFSELDKSEKYAPVLLVDKAAKLNSTDLRLQETEDNQTIYKFKPPFDTHTSKEESASYNRECFTLGDTSNSQLSILEREKDEYKNEDMYLKTKNLDEIQENTASTSVKNLPETGFIRFGGVSFQTASGKSLKISETALQAAEKMFEDISSNNLDVFPVKKARMASQQETSVGDKRCLGFHTASGKSLHASKVALEAAEKMFKEISVEETDVFLEKLSQTKPKNKELYPGFKECSGDEMSNVLVDNFFEDIAFDEKENDSKPATALISQKSDTPKITQTYKRKKSLGGRRTMKPYASKKL